MTLIRSAEKHVEQIKREEPVGSFTIDQRIALAQAEAEIAICRELEAITNRLRFLKP